MFQLQGYICLLKRHGRISCGIPLYANATSTKCKHCDQIVHLRINPRVVSKVSNAALPQGTNILQVGTLIDETGSIGPGKLIWSDDAWNQLLGRSAGELVVSNSDQLRSLECRLLFVRISLFFGWSQRMGKLCACAVIS